MPAIFPAGCRRRIRGHFRCRQRQNRLGRLRESKGVEFRFNTPIIKLVQDESGAVTGAIAEGPDGYIKINASKGTVVCTGGYARNEDMLKALQPQTMDKYSLSIAIDGTTGDGIKACLWAGAHMDEVHTAMVFDRVAVKPDEFGGSDTVGSLFWMGSNPWLKVNLNGERFTTEAEPYDYILNATLTQPHHTVVDIWDSDYAHTYPNMSTGNCCGRSVTFSRKCALGAGAVRADFAHDPARRDRYATIERNRHAAATEGGAMKINALEEQTSPFEMDVHLDAEETDALVGKAWKRMARILKCDEGRVRQRTEEFLTAHEIQ
ncbi:MAG: FAD-binding protein, partial [Eggerthellaceae bacterium]